MDSKKIKISIDNPSHYTQLALILDRPKVAEAIFRLHIKWEEILAKTQPKSKVGGRGQQDMGFEIFPGEPVTDGEYFGFQDDISALVKQYQISPAYRDCIDEAVRTSEVKTFVRVQTFAISRELLDRLIWENEENIENILSDKTHEYFLFIPLEATEKEVVKAFRRLKKKGNDYYSYLDTKTVADTKGMIKNHRDWYWMHLPVERGGEGKSYLQIATEKLEGYDSYQQKDTVRKGIKHYESLLQK